MLLKGQQLESSVVYLDGHAPFTQKVVSRPHAYGILQDAAKVARQFMDRSNSLHFNLIALAAKTEET